MGQLVDQARRNLDEEAVRFNERRSALLKTMQAQKDRLSFCAGCSAYKLDSCLKNKDPKTCKGITVVDEKLIRKIGKVLRQASNG